MGTEKTTAWTQEDYEEKEEQRRRDNPPVQVVTHAIMPNGETVPIAGIKLEFRGPNSMALVESELDQAHEEIRVLRSELEKANNAVRECQETNERLSARIAELESGIVLPGWWCFGIRESGCRCDTFNGESKDKTNVCRRCDRPKPKKPTPPRP